MKTYLNLGCGTRFHSEWTNVDFVTSGAGVLSCDLRAGVPFEDGTFDVVYHSHLLEHFPKSDGANLLKECYRVLKPGGVHRVAVPDLEGIARAYLNALSDASSAKTHGQLNYEWMLLELLDQTVRDRPGGEMQRYLQQTEVINEDFVVARIGVEGQRIIDSTRTRGTSQSPPRGPSDSQRIIQRLRRLPSSFKENFVRLLLRREYPLLQKGRFRSAGEIHQWMYDRYSLPLALRDAGFKNPKVVSATESQIPNWKDYNLDTEPDGSVYKPDSLFVEATK